MALSDTAIRGLKAMAKVQKMADGGGLFLQIETTGSRLWRFSYRYEGKQRTISFGAYPIVTLAAARAKRDAAKVMLTEGADPSPRRQPVPEAPVPDARKVTFADVAAEYRKKRVRENSSRSTLAKFDWIISMLQPFIGDTTPREITPPGLLKALREVEAKGHYETAARMRSTAGQVFRYAIAVGECDRDPSGDLRGALTAPQTAHHPGLTEPKAVGGLLRAIRGYEGAPSVRAALLFMAYQFPRPGEARFMEWSDVDLAECRVTIPAERMKMKRRHIIPLSRQTVALLQALRPITGGDTYVFAGARRNRALSDNTMNSALRSMGYNAVTHVPHGFRTTASTNLNELGWNADWIERQLAHLEGNAVRRAYNAAEFLEGRAQMMQAWADQLDAWESGPV